MITHADLHTHTKASDGTCDPAENVRLAKEAGLAAVAITDHDTVAGVPSARKAAEELGIEVIPGIEVSSVGRGQDIHVLGYFVPYEDEAFQERLVSLRETRHERNQLLIARLQELGIPITLENVYRRKQGTDKNIGRPHIAEELIELGVVASIDEAFAKYLGKEGAAYVNPPRITPQQAITLIKDAGGAAVLAHPGLYDADDLVEELIAFGLDGIEVNHPDNDPDQRARYTAWANEHGLVITGGSDFHGWRGEEPFHAMLGTHTAPMEAVEKLREIAVGRKAQK
ncbi:PHP domain-containing protein [Brevibacillus centrosporus]|uniref:PHP domain-containing protein n=1 Tax=Brevibacillus centrosporus TaxID=54910 RepID=UPI000F0A83F9|nr:PHP domain-containing protein [Brevibacillus centrosporus]MEC2131914.1 PHP domain-containing protein [Brevibacillus centrosporus]MED4909338.1 PHP domain-containing protein [Brevibacillus centrosporus]RNB64028.1 PHP domain-containing protein [Brevibacillus centrosporus]GED34181.1 PHP-like protein [Brevibacillus centrosporus]